MSVVKIREALKAHLDALSPALDTVYPGMNYTPTVGTPYQRVALLPARSQNAGLGMQAPTRETGIFQVSAWYGADAEVEALARAELIRLQFDRGTPDLTFDGLTVRIAERPSVGPVLIGSDDDAGWLSAPVSVRYFAHVFPS